MYRKNQAGVVFNGNTLEHKTKGNSHPGQPNKHNGRAKLQIVQNFYTQKRLDMSKKTKNKTSFTRQLRSHIRPETILTSQHIKIYRPATINYINYDIPNVLEHLKSSLTCLARFDNFSHI